jgi:hypothetical protein
MWQGQAEMGGFPQAAEITEKSVFTIILVLSVSLFVFGQP